MAVMRGDRPAQHGQPHHRRILVVAVPKGVGRPLPHIGRPGIVGKTLAEIDRPVLPGEPRHDVEDGRGKFGEDRIHRGSFTGETRALAVDGEPSLPVARPP